MDHKEISEKKPKEEVTLKTVELGIYKLTLPISAGGWDLRDSLKQVSIALPLIRRLATEIYALEPLLSVLYVASQFWNGIEGALLLYLSSRLLKIVSVICAPSDIV